MIRAFLFAQLFICLLSPVALLADSDAGVDSWDSELRIAKDGTVTITEQLLVNVPPRSKIKTFRHFLPLRPGPVGSSLPPIQYKPLRGYIDSSAAKIWKEEKGRHVIVYVGSDSFIPPGRTTLIFQFEAKGLAYTVENSDRILWYAARPWPGGVRKFSMKIYPPPYYELENLGIQRIELVNGQEKISKPSISILDGAVVISGEPIVKKEASFVLIDLLKGFLSPR